MKIDKVFSVKKERSCVLGISFDMSKSPQKQPRQFIQFYVQILFWEFSFLFAWYQEANK